MRIAVKASGVVDEVGDGVDQSLAGARVVTHLGLASGGYAALAVSDRDALRDVPGEVGYETAVAMMGTGRMTMGILQVAQLVPEDVVLVTAAAGGIGHLLVQAARNMGAKVVAAAGGAANLVRLVRGRTNAVHLRRPA